MDTPLERKPVKAKRLNHRHRKSAKSAQASRVTNGSALLPNVDGRTAWVRRVKDLVAQHVSDLGGEVSVSEFALVKRCAVLCTELEYREMGFANAGHADDTELAIYQTCVNTLRRTLESLGLQRRPRDVTPTLQQYLAEHYGAQEEPDEQQPSVESEAAE